MKKIIGIIMIALSGPAWAGIPHSQIHVHHGHNHFHRAHRIHNPIVVHPHHFRYRYNWVVPAVIGGAVVYSITNTNTHVVPMTLDQSDQIVINGILYKKTVMIVNGVEQIVFVKVDTNEIVNN